MKIEHFALNVLSPAAMSEWYEEHLGMKIVRRSEGPSKEHFLADESGKVMLELYNNKSAPVPNYEAMSPFQLHLAFVSDKPAEDRERLSKAGARFVEEIHLEDGSHLLMMRDPWGTPIQFCKRGKPMLQ